MIRSGVRALGPVPNSYGQRRRMLAETVHQHYALEPDI